MNLFKKIFSLIFVFTFLVSISSCGEEVKPVEENLVNYTIDYVYVKNNASLNSSTGSYDNFKYNNYKFSAYRAYSTSGAVELIPYKDTLFSHTLPGFLTNITSFGDVRKLTLTYKCDSDSKLRYGNNTDKKNSLTIPSKGEYETVEFNLNDTNYFSLETLNDSFYLKKLVIGFKAIDVDEEDLAPIYNYRVNPIAVKNNPNNLDTVNVPIKYEYVNNKLNILEYKTYTYYDTEYIINHPELAASAACTDPMDVANYYIAFKAFPTNYVYKEDFDSIYYLFKNKTRCVSRYDRTDGYAVAVPYNVGNNGKPLYYEFDIALNEKYSTGSRGMGRVVMWDYGFSYKDYDLNPVAVYTDDHYKTFQEFNNLGSFNQRFDAELIVTFNKFSSITINL